MTNTHEKILNIANYLRHANQNYNEVPPHTGQNGHHYKVYKNQIQEKVWQKGNPPALLVGMKTGAVSVENHVEVPQKTKTRVTPHDPAILFLGIY